MRCGVRRDCYTGSGAMATTLTPPGPFVNEPITDYRQPDNVRGMRQAIEEVRAQLGREYHLVIGGEPIRTKDKIVSINPANPSEVIGIHQKAGLAASGSARSAGAGGGRLSLAAAAPSKPAGAATCARRRAICSLATR